MVDENKLIDDLIRCKGIGRKTCEIIFELIGNQTKVDGWIPCVERLPEEEGMYLITSKVLDKTEVQYVFFQKDIGLFICNGIPTAWKHLPEPYTENRKD